MFTLETFYKTKEWEDLLKVLKLQRVNEDGVIICEYCHKPIVRAYDCIGHHSIFLTPQNINDINISLNPDLIQFVHHRCHNRIHNKLGRTRREVFVVYGSPFAGKSSWVAANAEPGDLIVDIDRIWNCVSGLPMYEKPPKLNAVVFGVRDYLLESIKLRLGKWDNAYIIGGYPITNERERLVKSLGAREVFIESTKEECLERLSNCEDGRSFELWENFINDWWKKYHPPISI